MSRETNSERLARIEERIKGIERLIKGLEVEDTTMHRVVYKWLLALTVVVVAQLCGAENLLASVFKSVIGV